MIEHQPLDLYVINTHSLHNTHLLRRALPRDLIAPIPFIDPDQREAEHAKLVAKWRENPKSRTAQEQAREKKRVEEAAKGKKGKGRGKKCSVDGAIKGEDPKEVVKGKKGKRGKKRSADGVIKGDPKEEVKEGMVLISELDALPQFLAGIYDDMGNGQLE